MARASKVRRVGAAAADPGEPGTVYLLHFDKPYRHARHYVGWAKCLDKRLAHHRAGSGARLTAAVAAAGIEMRVARTWQGTRRLERALHRYNGASKFCPVCNPGTRRGRMTTTRARAVKETRLTWRVA